MHKNKKLYIKIHRNMHKNQKSHLLSQIKPCILNQTENIPPIPANPFTIGINGFIVFMIMPIYTQIRHLRKDGLHD